MLNRLNCCGRDYRTTFEYAGYCVSKFHIKNMLDTYTFQGFAFVNSRLLNVPFSLSNFVRCRGFYWPQPAPLAMDFGEEFGDCGFCRLSFSKYV